MTNAVPSDSPATTRRARSAWVWVFALVALSAAAASGYATFLFCVLRLVAENSLHPRSFDASVWNHTEWQTSETSATRYHSIRQRMVDDLLATQLRPGLTRAAVTQLIGTPDETPPFRRGAADAWCYRLGAERGLGVDSEWLVVEFDDRGGLSRALLETH